MVLLIKPVTFSATRCSDLQTCDECQRNPSCGWCDNGENMGLGLCMEGGADAPVDVNGTIATINKYKCPGDRWYFTECPCKLGLLNIWEITRGQLQHDSYMD